MAMALEDVVQVWVVVVEVAMDVEQVLYIEMLRDLAVVKEVVQVWRMIVGVFREGGVFVHLRAVGKQCNSFA